MRPQQNRRMRGRGSNNNNNNNNSGGGNNNNRKGPNPLTRSYESNGPDVKIRGSAQQIAEKYTTLARDAQTSGDRVMAENYLQHAEHYNRIIMVALAQQSQQQVRENNTRDDEDMDDDGEEGFQSSGNDQQPVQQQQREPRENRDNNRDRDNREGRDNRDNRGNVAPSGTGPQPVIEGVPAEVALKQQDVAPVSSDQQPAVAEVQVPAADEENAEAAPRRPRRPRRPRVKAEDAAEGDQPSGSDEPVTEAAQ
ncbi:DUF4167 domain-containing protein [Mesorhizobium sp. CAU 1732]|uniref:DUF4167 domain-containing protein n=1 Tax=Mesorhizobium sp. CAU 1732 TaxID=3140358 RepID=UPI0032608484